MSEHRIRTGDVVAVTARVVGVRGDGSFAIEPLGFDYIAFGEDDEQELPIEFYTVDEPKLVQHVWTRGDELFAHRMMFPTDDHRVEPGERFVYDKPLGNGLHLLNMPDLPQHSVRAWVVMSTAIVGELQSDPPEISDE